MWIVTFSEIFFLKTWRNSVKPHSLYSLKELICMLWASCSQIRGIQITWELLRKTNSQAPAQSHWIWNPVDAAQTSTFLYTLQWFWHPLKLESHCSRLKLYSLKALTCRVSSLPGLSPTVTRMEMVPFSELATPGLCIHCRVQSSRKFPPFGYVM